MVGSDGPNPCIADVLNRGVYHKNEKDALSPDPEQEANARLIAAAPELLEALRMVDDFEAYVINEAAPDISTRNKAWIKQARAAIAKAEGRAE